MLSSALRLALTLALITTVGAASAEDENRLLCGKAPRPLDELLGIESAAVLFVDRTKPGSPAEQLGLSLGDLIASVNGRSLREYGDSREFSFAIREAAMLSRAVLEVWKYDPVSESYRPSKVEARIPAREGEQLGLLSTFEMVIVKVPKGGAAERAGIRPWDFIQEVDGRVIWTLGSPVAIDQRVNEAASRGDQVSLTVYRWKPAPLSSGGRTIHFPRKVTVPLGVDANSEEPVSDAP